MPLHARKAPPAALRTVLAALDSTPASHATGRLRAALALGTPLTPEAALPLYLLGGVRGGTPRSQAAGWRFLVRQAERTVVTADATPTADGWVFSHFAEGPYADSVERCLLLADTLTGPYEPRLLSVPELYMMALWLHGLGSAERPDDIAETDLLVPLSPAPPGVAANRPHRARELLPLLTERLAAPVGLMRTA
ncbi:hypothetical protein GL263_03025 [Streptomyces durbertensis]|uniref:Secreted protein n=1 Tax=Streptomyces durbertensis TaxID=2448886 RepID=A0ABR6EB30_9ACTN|nr:hypothetical protein [Streptomyces durbertensis]MBB1242547.1 hypothetical protein [Streptomyces durbertensis]